TPPARRARLAWCSFRCRSSCSTRTANGGAMNRTTKATGRPPAPTPIETEVVAGNGLLHRRIFLQSGAAMAAAFTGYALSDTAAAQQLADDPWSRARGIPIPEYATPSSFEKGGVRTLTNPKGQPRTQHARTPHHLLNGTFTPN